LTETSQETVTIDRLDRQIVHALGRNGRVPFRLLAEVLSSSEQTVARRYRRLREAGVMRVIVVPETDRLAQGWFVRMRIKPSAVAAFAELIARRDDVSWVSMTAGGTEVTCVVRPRSREERDTVLLERLPRTSQITALAPSAILHPFVSETSEWDAYGDPLTLDQHRRIAATGWHGPHPGSRPGARIEPADAALLRALRRDGRATYAELAAATGWSPAQATRRLDALLESGAVYLDLETATELLGFHVTALLWVTVGPRHLDAVGRAVAEHEETAFVAAISGTANLCMSVVCRDSDHLYEYVTARLGAIDGIGHVEISPVLRRVKQAGTMMDGVRLPNPTVE
jgi:DNA-binding Lrp family transcriptional regulator